MSGPRILEFKIRHLVNKIKNEKSPSPDEVYVEVLKQHVTYHFSVIYVILANFIGLVKDNFGALLKKFTLNFSLIRLMNCILKAFLRVSHSRIYKTSADIDAA